MKLVDSQTKEPIKVGDLRKTFRGEQVRILAFYEPGDSRAGGMTGRIYVEFVDGGFHQSFYTKVIDGVEWVE